MQRESLSNHILPVSATMVGVCMTVVSVLQLTMTHAVAPWVDGLLATDSLLFLISAGLSYWSLRHRKDGGIAERFADRVFLFALAVMVLASFAIAFELS